MVRHNDRDLLIGLVGTLTDSQCRELYYYITSTIDRFDFERGLVKLTSGQYNKLVWLWGKDKVDKCIDILNEWLEDKGDKIQKYISHYRQLIGWVERKYYQLYPATDKSIRFTNKIDTKWKAESYIRKIPKELRAYDSEVKFLVNKYDIDITKFK